MPRDPDSRYSQINSTTTIKENKGVLNSIFVSSASSTPQLTVYDATDTSGTVMVNTWTPSGGEEYLTSTAQFDALTVEISGTVECTVFYD